MTNRVPTDDDRIERALRTLPLEETRAGFTASVMRELGLAEGAARKHRVVEALAASVALLLVLGTIVTIFAITGVIGESDLSTASAIGPAVDAAQGRIAGWLRVALEWLGSVTPTLTISRSLEVGLMMIAAIGGIALADHLLLRRAGPHGRGG